MPPHGSNPGMQQQHYQMAHHNQAPGHQVNQNMRMQLMNQGQGGQMTGSQGYAGHQMGPPPPNAPMQMMPQLNPRSPGPQSHNHRPPMHHHHQVNNLFDFETNRTFKQNFLAFHSRFSV